MNKITIYMCCGITAIVIIYFEYKKYIADNNNMKWSEVLEEWKSGKYLTYPKKLKNSFFWETTPIFANKDTVYKQKFIQSKKLNGLKQDYRPFAKQIKDSNNMYVTSFYNLSGDAMLVVPMPRSDGRSYATLKEFMDNATMIQQKIFWKEVAKQIEKMLKNNDKLWVSTHGLGVSYLHVRICKIPKYYITKSFVNR